MGKSIGRAEVATHFGMPSTGGIAQSIGVVRVTQDFTSEASVFRRLKLLLTGLAPNSLMLSKDKNIRSFYRMPLGAQVYRSNFFTRSGGCVTPETCGGSVFLEAGPPHRNEESMAYTSMQLKVCERCGVLWCRAEGDTGVYCSPCGDKLRSLPPRLARRKRGRPTKAEIAAREKMEVSIR